MSEDAAVAPPRVAISTAGQHVGETVEIAGWLYNLRKSGKIAFPLLRDGTGIMQCVAVKSAPARGALRNAQGSDPGIVADRSRQDPRRTARARRLRNGRRERRSRSSACRNRDPYPITPKEHGIDFLMDHRHLWLRSRRQHAILRVRHEVIKAIRDYFDSQRLHAGGHAHLHARRLRRHHHAVRSELLRRRESLPDAVRPALQRSHRHGLRQGLLLRSDVPRREIQDPPASDRVLDGGAGDGLRRRSKTSSAWPRS